MNNKKIDLVYTWVNDKDNHWRNKCNQYRVQNDKKDFEARYSNNNELLYSLRSAEKFAPWINHIFIITDNQIPEWLNLDNAKISIVDHTKIIPREYLPTFNSIVIEHCLKNIPNLSEFFLYANDDMFFWDKVQPEFFFTDNDKVINRYQQVISDTNNDKYFDLIKNSINLIENKYGKFPFFLPHHNIDSYKKTAILRCYQIFQKDINRTLTSKFREIKNIPRFIYNNYSLVTNQGIYKQMEEDSLYIDSDFPYDIEQFLQTHKPKLLCFNDIKKTLQKDRDNYINILKKYFPEKSEFEKSVF